jgi:hypothetical protein
MALMFGVLLSFRPLPSPPASQRAPLPLQLLLLRPQLPRRPYIMIKVFACMEAVSARSLVLLPLLLPLPLPLLLLSPLPALRLLLGPAQQPQAVLALAPVLCMVIPALGPTLPPIRTTARAMAMLLRNPLEHLAGLILRL